MQIIPNFFVFLLRTFLNFYSEVLENPPIFAHFYFQTLWHLGTNRAHAAKNLADFCLGTWRIFVWEFGAIYTDFTI